MEEMKQLIDELIYYKRTYDTMRNQTDIAIEEMSELTKEITKHFRNKITDSSIIEEASDVILSSYILLKLFDYDDEQLIVKIRYKVERTLEEYRKKYKSYNEPSGC